MSAKSIAYQMKNKHEYLVEKPQTGIIKLTREDTNKISCNTHYTCILCYKCNIFTFMTQTYRDQFQSDADNYNIQKLSLGGYDTRTNVQDKQDLQNKGKPYPSSNGIAMCQQFACSICAGFKWNRNWCIGNLKTTSIYLAILLDMLHILQYWE